MSIEATYRNKITGDTFNEMAALKLIDIPE